MKAERDYGSGLSPPTVFAPLFIASYLRVKKKKKHAIFYPNQAIGYSVVITVSAFSIIAFCSERP